MIVIVMGVSGAGKSTVGKAVSERLGWPFRDADEFHPASNVEKMSRGIPLNDEDRHPWLQRLAALCADHLRRGESLVLACSALRKKYRDYFPQGSVFVLLDAPAEVLETRLEARQNHFMKANMLGSQLATLERTPDLRVVDVTRPLPRTVDEIVSILTTSSFP